MPANPWVVCVPGFGGSKLGWTFQSGTVGGITHVNRKDVWVNPGWFAEHGFRVLELPENGSAGLAPPPLQVKITAEGIIPLYYDYLHQWLVRAGFKPIWAHYDWRLRTEEAYRSVYDQFLNYAQGEPVALVGHSRGGLIAARVMKELVATGQGSLVTRLCTFGTPWYGSYLPVPWLCGYANLDNRVLQLLLVLGNLLHKEPVLNQLYRAARTFPGLYELLPDPVKAKSLGDTDVGLLYDPAWYSTYNNPCTSPYKETPIPVSHTHLAAALAYRGTSPLPPAGFPHKVIMSNNFATFGGVVKRNFCYNFERVAYSEDGDGVVPAWSAAVPGADTTLTDSDHGGMVQSPVMMDVLVGWLNAA